MGPLRSGLATLLIAAACLSPAGAGPRVQTMGGMIEGAEQAGVAAYKGIPYAAPPTGTNRWRAPQPVRAWSGVRDATRFGHSCWQAVSPAGFGPWTHEYVVAGDVSEDCLFLNVWAPVRRSGPLPVLVWIHGGAFTSGSGAIPIYDGAALASRGAVVVTINYRLGVFGFLAHPDLTREAGHEPPANFGLLDIIAALRWVQANVAGFGGNPRAVTIAGQSAGAMAVQELVSSPLAKGLFQRAIAESGLPRPLEPLTDAEAEGAAFAREKGVTSIAALRALPAEALQPREGSNAGGFGPIADGRLLADAPWRPASDVPMMVGLNADEGSTLGRDYGSDDAGRLTELLRASFGPLAERFAALYPAASAGERARSNRQVHRDRGLGAVDAWANERAETARTPVYAYLFSHVMPGSEANRWGAFHSSEIPYVFRTFAASPERPFTAEDRQLSDLVSGYWLNFIRGGDPNGAGLPTWPALTLNAPKILQIDDVPEAQPLLPPDKLELMRQHGKAGGSLSLF